MTGKSKIYLRGILSSKDKKGEMMKRLKKLLILSLACGLLAGGAQASEITESTIIEAREEAKLQTNLKEVKEEDGYIRMTLVLENKGKDRAKGRLLLDKIAGEDLAKVFDGDKDKSYDLKPGEKADLVFDLILKEDLKVKSYPIFFTININNIQVSDKIDLPIKEGQAKDPKNKGKDGAKDKGDLSKEEMDKLAKDLAKDKKEGQDSKEEPGKKGEESNKGGLLGQSMGGQGGDVGQMPSMPKQVPEIGQVPSMPDQVPDFAGSGGAGPSQEAGAASIGGSDQVKNKPKLIISQYSFEPANPLAGEEFKMDLSFFNTNQDKSVRNIKISLSSSEGAPSPQVEGLGQQAASGESSVFTPVGSSNTFYIDRIDPKSTISKSVRLITPSSLATKNYSLVATFEYEDKDGNQYASQETIGIPIVQESKLSTSEVVFQDMAFVGMPIDGEIQFYNTGKDTLNNLMARVEGDFDDISLEEYVGNFESGKSSSYYFTISPKEAGQQKGKIIFTYEDQLGKTRTVEKDFKLKVEEDMPMDPELENGDQEEEKKSFNMPGPFFFLGLLILAVIIGVAIFQRKKRLKEEKDMTIDED